MDTPNTRISQEPAKGGPAQPGTVAALTPATEPEGPTHEQKGRNTTVTRCRVDCGSYTGIPSSHAAPRLPDPPNAASRRSASDTESGAERCTSPRAERGAEKTRGICDAGKTRHWNAEALIEQPGSRIGDPLLCRLIGRDGFGGGVGASQHTPADVRPQLFASHTGETFNSWTVFSRNTSRLPVADRGLGHTQLQRKSAPAPGLSCGAVYRVLIRSANLGLCFHGLPL